MLHILPIYKVMLSVTLARAALRSATIDGKVVGSTDTTSVSGIGAAFLKQRKTPMSRGGRRRSKFDRASLCSCTSSTAATVSTDFITTSYELPSDPIGMGVLLCLSLRERESVCVCCVEGFEIRRKTTYRRRYMIYIKLACFKKHQISRCF